MKKVCCFVFMGFLLSLPAAFAGESCQSAITKIVLTGAASSGKSSALQTVAGLGLNLTVIPEAATIVFSGGFLHASNTSRTEQIAVQIAIAGVQEGLESFYPARFSETKLFVLDRGIVDGAAYHPDGISGFEQMTGKPFAESLNRYDWVIFLMPAPRGKFGGKENPARNDTEEEARATGDKLYPIWKLHHRLITIPSFDDFAVKKKLIADIVRGIAEGKSLEALQSIVKAARASHRQSSAE